MFGSIFARELTDKGKRCLVIDKRTHIGGNCFTENIEDINVHKYGPHIFHTSDEVVWQYIRKYCEFNNYINRPKVFYKGRIFSFPINLMTLYQLFGVSTPREAIELLEKKRIPSQNSRNFEEWILSQVGEEIYYTFIRGYTKKQWNKNPKDLPASIIKRLPIRTNFDDNYYTDKYQGIPIGGYTQIFRNLLRDIDVRLDCDYFDNRDYFDSLAEKIVYTGPIDRFYSYRFGKLEYRSLEFKNELLGMPDYQGNAIMNYTDENVEWTRIVEHKHFEFGNQPHTFITREYPRDSGEPYYPINDATNNERYGKYKDLMGEETNFIFGGRLADYKYYDMHQVIGSALARVKRESSA